MIKLIASKLILKEAANYYNLKSTTRIIAACKDPNKTSANNHWEYVS